MVLYYQTYSFYKNMTFLVVFYHKSQNVYDITSF